MLVEEACDLQRATTSVWQTQQLRWKALTNHRVIETPSVDQGTKWAADVVCSVCPCRSRTESPWGNLVTQTRLLHPRWPNSSRKSEISRTLSLSSVSLVYMDCSSQYCNKTAFVSVLVHSYISLHTCQENSQMHSSHIYTRQSCRLFKILEIDTILWDSLRRSINDHNPYSWLIWSNKVLQ